MRGRSGGRPPPIFASWKAEWTTRAASAAWSSSTTKEMLSSDEPWAMAITLMPPGGEGGEDPGGDAGGAGHPAADHRDDGQPGSGGHAVDETGGELHLEGRPRAPVRARSASAPGTVKPIELSDDDWKIVETDSPASWMAENVRAAMPGHAHEALARHRDEGLVADGGQGLHRVGLESAARGDLGARVVLLQEGAHLQGHPAAVEGDESAGVEDLGAEVGDLGRLAVVHLRQQARVGHARGSAVRIPFTSFQRTTREAPSVRARRVAVRSVPPRPRVVSVPSGPAPKKPGTTGVTPRLSRGDRRRRAFRRVAGMSGAAEP